MARKDRFAHVASLEQPDRMIEADVHARQHRSVRTAHRTELIEDYVELIADLIDSRGEARAADIAQRLDVKPATVAKMVTRLQREGLVTTEPYRAIFLTDSGRAMATDSRRRHVIVLRFLLSIGVSESTAFADAEGIEHHVSEETLDALQRVIEQKQLG